MSFKSWFCAGIALACGSLPAHASDLTDPAFLPAARQFTGATTFGYGTDSGNVEDAQGFPQYSFDSHTEVLTQSLDYGITQRLSVWGGLSQAWTTAHYDYAGGARTTERFVRWDVGVTYRVLDEARDPFNLDVSASIPGALSLALSREFQDFTIRASAGVYSGGGGRSRFDLVRGMDVDVGVYRGYDAALQGQLRLTPRLSINVAAQYVSSNLNGVQASADGNAFTIHYPDQVNLGVALNYHLIPNRLALRLGGSYQMLGARHDAYPDPSFDLLTAHRIRRAAGLGLIYSF